MGLEQRLDLGAHVGIVQAGIIQVGEPRRSVESGCRREDAADDGPSIGGRIGSLQRRRGYGNANTYIWFVLLGFSSGVSRLVAPATSDGPVLTATYCLPLTANVIG